jgi:hypothetical protein
MALQSRLFRGDPKLEAAAVSDPAHILQGASGPHVGKIQQALIQLDGAGIDPDGKYGPATARAVSAFKQKRLILNFAGKIDDIVGKKTIAALDAGMLAKERGGGKATIRAGVIRKPGSPTTVIVPTFNPTEIDRAVGAPSGDGGGGGRRLGVSDGLLQSLNPLVVRTFSEFPNSFILARSVELPNGPNGDKNDLDTAFPPTLPLKPAEQARINEGERRNTSTGEIKTVTILENNARLEALIANQSDGTGLMDLFIRNTNPNHVERVDVGTSISNRVRDSSGFATEHNGVEKDIREALQAQFLTGVIDYRLMRGQSFPKMKPGVVAVNPKGVKDVPAVAFGLSEPRMVALIGSFQACTLILKSFDVDKQLFTFRATLRYELIDHFGCDNSDVVFDGKGHGTEGQVDLWLLQHKFRPGHIPYRVLVIVEKEITGTLLDPALFPLLDPFEVLRQFPNAPNFFPA